MTFGLRNTAQIFQKFMDRVIAGLDFYFTYIDDILIASQDEIQHKEHLKILFDRLQLHGIAINPNKCVFGQKNVSFLGHIISVEGIKPLSEKVQGIAEFQEPVKGNFKLNFYNQFLKDLVSMQASLLNAISGRNRNNNAKIE